MSNTVAFNIPSPNSTSVPGFNLCPGLTIDSHISPSIWFNKRNSILAPVAFFPYNLAGITLVLFLTKQSPGSR